MSPTKVKRRKQNKGKKDEAEQENRNNPSTQLCKRLKRKAFDIGLLSSVKNSRSSDTGSDAANGIASISKDDGDKERASRADINGDRNNNIDNDDGNDQGGSDGMSASDEGKMSKFKNKAKDSDKDMGRADNDTIVSNDNSKDSDDGSHSRHVHRLPIPPGLWAYNNASVVNKHTTRGKKRYTCPRTSMYIVFWMD